MVIRNFLFALLVVAPVFICAENEFSTNSARSSEFVDEGDLYILEDNELFQAEKLHLSWPCSIIEKVIGRSLDPKELLVRVYATSKPLAEGMPQDERGWKKLGKSANWSNHDHPFIGSFPEYLPVSFIRGNEGESFVFKVGHKKVLLIRNQLASRYTKDKKFEDVLTALEEEFNAKNKENIK